MKEYAAVLVIAMPLFLALILIEKLYGYYKGEDTIDINITTNPNIDRQLLEKLYPGSSVANPIDFLATGTAEQLGHIIDACDNDFDTIDMCNACNIRGSIKSKL